MIIKTKFDIGDKLYYYLAEINEYVKCEIESIRTEDTEVTYYLKNPLFVYCHEYRVGGYADERYFSVPEDEAYKSPEELIKVLKKQSSEKIKALKERKPRKSIFSL